MVGSWKFVRTGGLCVFFCCSVVEIFGNDVTVMERCGL